MPACAALLPALGFFRIGNECAKNTREQSRALVDGLAYRALCSLLRRSGGGLLLFMYWQGGAWHVGRRTFRGELFAEGRTIAPVLDRLGAEGSFSRPGTQGAIEGGGGPAAPDVADGALRGRVTGA